MNASKTDLARVWADAIPLYEFVTQRAEREPPKSTEPAGLDALMEAASKDPTVRVFRNAALAIEQGAQTRAAIRRAQNATLNDLIAGRLTASDANATGSDESTHRFGSERK